MPFSRRGFLMLGTAPILTLVLPGVGGARPFDFNDFTKRSGEKRIELAGDEAAIMSGDNKNSISIRVHPSLIEDNPSKDKVLQFIRALVGSLNDSGFLIEGVTLVEDPQILEPFVFYPYFDGYIHPHVQGGISYVNDDLARNVLNISNGLRLSMLAQGVNPDQ